MDIVGLVAATAGLWVAHALGLARLMGSRGFDSMPWLAVSLLLGPAIWPLAVVELVSGPPGPVVLRPGHRAGGVLDVFVAFDRDELAEPVAEQIQRVLPRCGRLVLARVVKAGGPAFVPAEAERFLSDCASRLGEPGAELHLHHGVFTDVVREIRDQGNFDLVLRSDETSELFDGNSPRKEMRCLHDVRAA